MKNTKKLVQSLLTALLLGMFAFQGAAYAKGDCSGQKMKACNANDKCTWVKRYQKKDGTKVKGHCKAKGKKKK